MARYSRIEVSTLPGFSDISTDRIDIRSSVGVRVIRMMEHSRIETTSRAAKSERCPPNASATGAGRKVAILQSNYIPWKGYFDLINLADEFILFDEAQYSKRDWRNRNKVKTPHGLLWLTISVHVKGFPKIKDTVVSDPNWNREHRSITHPIVGLSPEPNRKLRQPLVVGERVPVRNGSSTKSSDILFKGIDLSGRH